MIIILISFLLTISLFSLILLNLFKLTNLISSKGIDNYKLSAREHLRRRGSF
jgi:hypothetical protein